MNIDPSKLDTVLTHAVGDLSAGYGGVMISLGHKLGLYRAMAGAGPLSSTEVARRSGCAERYIREWLNSQIFLRETSHTRNHCGITPIVCWAGRHEGVTASARRETAGPRRRNDATSSSSKTPSCD